MSKTLRTAAIIVGAVALVATGVGAAAVGAAATGAASAATLAGVAATATTIASIATATAAAASLGAAVTARPPPLGGSATRFKADKDAGIPYVMGRTATGGNIIYRRTHNTAGYSLPDLQTFVAVLSGGGPINAIETFTADKVTVTFSSGAALGSFAGWMWQTQQLGASPESAALRVTPGGTLPPGWTTAAKLSGMAAAMWTLRYDQKGKFYAQGVPVPLWVVQGVKVYDPRLDSTYPGGSGSCRAGTESTYVYSENPYLHALTFALGRYQNGKRVIGIGAPVTGIDVRAFVEGANVADANNWKVGGTITSADNKWAVLKTILQAGGGEPMHLGALLSCTISTPRVTLATVTTDDLIGEAQVTATTSRRDRFNTVIPRYRSEAHGWEMIPAAPVAVAAHITTDGGERSREITYSMVQQLDQAAELARYDIENAREFGPIVLPLKLRWIGYRPGDCVAVNLPEVGLNGQQIVIGNREIDADGLSVVLTARSETAAKHPFALGQTGMAPPTPSVSTAPTPPQPGAVAWSLSGAGLVAGATITPALIITGAATNVPIDAVVIEYRLWVSGQAAGVGWIGAGSYLPDVTRIELTAVLPSTAYEIAVSYRLGAFTGDRRIIGPVTTTAAGLEWNGIGGTGTPEAYATSSDNMIANSGLAINANGWTLDPGISRQAAAVGDPAPGYLLFNPSAARRASANNGALLPLAGGITKLFLAGWSYRNTAAAGAFNVDFYWLKADGTASSTPLSSVDILPVTALAWTALNAAVAVPSDAASCWISVFCNVSGSSVNAAGLRVASTQRGADVTALSLPLLTLPAGPTIYGDVAGAPLSGQLPRQLGATRLLGGINVSATTTWSITTAGCTATISSAGLIEITACTASGKIVVTSVRDGVTLIDEMPVTKINSVPSVTGGGAGSATTAYDTTITGTSSASYGSAQGGPLTVVAGAAGTVDCTAPLSFSGTAGAAGKWQWRVIGGSWADIASEIGSLSSAVVNEPDSGYIEVNQTKTGLTSGTSYEFQLLLRRSGGSGSLSFNGTAAAAGS